MEEKKNVFEYNYSPQRKEEVEQIVQKYMPEKEDAAAMIRRLDKNAERPGTIVAIAMGIIGCLLLGFGMACTMVWGTKLLFLVGIVVGGIGMIAIVMSYPLYKRITKKERDKIAPEIIELSKKIV